MQNTFGVLYPSEKLGANWEKANPQISISASQIVGRLVNPVSYAVYVEGELQPSYHALTGWRKASQVLRDDAFKIVEAIARAMFSK